MPERALVSLKSRRRRRKAHQRAVASLAAAHLIRRHRDHRATRRLARLLVRQMLLTSSREAASGSRWACMGRMARERNAGRVYLEQAEERIRRSRRAFSRRQGGWKARGNIMGRLWAESMEKASEAIAFEGAGRGGASDDVRVRACWQISLRCTAARLLTLARYAGRARAYRIWPGALRGKQRAILWCS